MLFCEGLFKEGAKCYSSYSGCINNGSNCVCEDKFVGETKVLCFLMNDMDPLGTGVFPIVTEHS